MNRTMKWELWCPKVHSQDLGQGEGTAHLVKLGPIHQAEGVDLVLCEDAVSGVLARWTLKCEHPGSPAPLAPLPRALYLSWLLQRAVICDREQLDSCTCGSFSAGLREATLAGGSSSSQWAASLLLRSLVNLIWRHRADPAFTSENPGKRQPQM